MRAMNRMGAVVVVMSAMALAGAAEPPRAGLPAKEGLEFKVKPSVKADGDPSTSSGQARVQIDFEVNKATDVAVEVLDKDGKVVRHLAAGLLGPNAPEPLAKDSLRQSLVWDGKDDSGKQVSGVRFQAGTSSLNPEPRTLTPFRVRVGLGLSPTFDKVLGWHPLSGMGAMDALAVNARGELYVLTGTRLLVLDSNGQYVREILPGKGRVSPQEPPRPGAIGLADGAIVQDGRSEPGLRNTGMALTREGDIFVVSGYNFQRKATLISRDGVVERSPHPWLIHWKNDVGFIKPAVTPDGEWLYVAGQMWGHSDSAIGTVGGVQHIVSRLNLKGDQAAEVFLGENENPGANGSQVNRPKAVATDSQGNVYVADYGNNRIGVWDKVAIMIREIKVPAPQEVYVHPKNGEIYVLSGPEKTIPRWEGTYFWQSATLIKFSPEGKELARLELEPPFIQKKPGEPDRPKFMLTGALDSSKEQAKVYVGSGGGDWLLVRVDDLGDKFAAPVSLLKDVPAALQTARYVALDRPRDEVYVRDGGLWKLWRFDGASGKGEPLPMWKVPRTGRGIRGSEMSVGPDGLLYISCWHANWDTSVLRYDRDGNPVPFKSTGSNEILQKGMFSGSSGQRSKGIYPAPDGRLYVMYEDGDRKELPESRWDRTCLKTMAVDAYDLDGNLLKKRLIGHLRGGGSGVRADRWGNVYVGDNVKPLGYAYPAEAAAVLPDPFPRACIYMGNDGHTDPLIYDYGCVFKFPPTGGQIVGLDTVSDVRAPAPAGNLWSPVPEIQWFPWHRRQVRVTGAVWQYLGIARMPAQVWAASSGEACVCSAAAFDLDEHARVYVPDTLTHRVKVLDRNGALIAVFGERGNMDDQGPAIRFGPPRTVAASSKALYVADAQNARVVRVKVAYLVEEAVSCP